MTTFTHGDLGRVVQKLRESEDTHATHLTENDVERVVAALENPEYQWRTIRGIAREVGLDEDAVVAALAALQDWVIRASITAPSGDDLYTTRDHFRKSGSLLQRLRGVLMNRAP